MKKGVKYIRDQGVSGLCRGTGRHMTHCLGDCWGGERGGAGWNVAGWMGAQLDEVGMDVRRM